MEIYEPNFNSYLERIKELAEYKEKAQSRTIKIFIDKLINLTSVSFKVHEEITDFFYPQMIKNVENRINHGKFIEALNANRYPQGIDGLDESSKFLLENPDVSQETKDSILKSHNFLVESKKRNDEFIRNMTMDVLELMEFERDLDSEIYADFLNITSRPLFEQIYDPSLRNVDNEISHQLIHSLVKYGIEKLGISGKAEAELFYEIVTMVNKKKFILDQIEKSDFILVEVFEPYEELITSWIITNLYILENMKRNNKA